MSVISTLTNTEWKTILQASEHCLYCRRPFGPNLKPSMDHKIPLAFGGGHTKENVVAACRPCNSMKHTKTPEQFMIYLQRWGVVDEAYKREWKTRNP